MNPNQPGRGYSLPPPLFDAPPTFHAPPPPPRSVPGPITHGPPGTMGDMAPGMGFQPALAHGMMRGQVRFVPQGYPARGRGGRGANVGMSRGRGRGGHSVVYNDDPWAEMEEELRKGLGPPPPTKNQSQMGQEMGSFWQPQSDVKIMPIPVNSEAIELPESSDDEKSE